jgi:hypothetical protein
MLSFEAEKPFTIWISIGAPLLEVAEEQPTRIHSRRRRATQPVESQFRMSPSSSFVASHSLSDGSGVVGAAGAAAAVAVGGGAAGALDAVGAAATADVAGLGDAGADADDVNDVAPAPAAGGSLLQAVRANANRARKRSGVRIRHI